MGSPMSPIIANLVMEWFEQNALESDSGIPQDYGYAMLTIHLLL